MDNLMHGGHAMLAQNAAASAVEILQWLVVLVAAAVVIVVVALVVRRRYLASDDHETSPGFLLADLRQLHAEGKLSDEEFRTAKAAMIARSRAALADEDPAGPGDESRPFPTDVDQADPGGPAEGVSGVSPEEDDAAEEDDADEEDNPPRVP